MSNINTNTSFAVLGSNGAISPFVIDALAKHSGVKKLIVLSRPRPSSSSKPSNLPANAELVAVDYNNHSALVEVFTKYSTDVVISTLSDAAIFDAQKKAAVAAREAGVKVFVPVEFGNVTIGLAGKGERNGEGEGEDDIQVKKDRFAEFLKSIELPYIHVFTGLWLRWIPWVFGYDVNQKFNIIGKGETPASFLAHILTTLPLSQLSNTHFRLQGERLTVRQIADRLGKPYVTNVEAIPGSRPSDWKFRTLIASQCDSGVGSTGWDHFTQKDNPGPGPNPMSGKGEGGEGSENSEATGSGNKFWEGHVWKRLEDVVTL
ncbi:hypothetical protein D9758_012914 [Tetrapyrgos nigripes]|uniref:NmrA-like domain-containing protein n=1 Tax=Tetrapyrgos nigripes TaxID=182062 RepID=A0A8H5FP58_9AGAR|nr:hypothetical protein D9758_012914 [Tetrapyrgos nigripes]